MATKWKRPTRKSRVKTTLAPNIALEELRLPGSNLIDATTQHQDFSSPTFTSNLFPTSISTFSYFRLQPLLVLQWMQVNIFPFPPQFLLVLTFSEFRNRSSYFTPLARAENARQWMSGAWSTNTRSTKLGQRTLPSGGADGEGRCLPHGPPDLLVISGPAAWGGRGSQEFANLPPSHEWLAKRRTIVPLIPPKTI
jgi:hypothetical protein